MVSPKQAPGTKTDNSAKPRQPSQPKHEELVDPTLPNQSQIEISNLLHNLPLNAYVELARRFLTSVPTLPCGPARSWGVLKIILLCEAKKVERPRRNIWTKALWLPCLNADALRGRKHELDHFLGQHGVGICLLTETNHSSVEVFRLQTMFVTTTSC